MAPYEAPNYMAYSAIFLPRSRGKYFSGSYACQCYFLDCPPTDTPFGQVKITLNNGNTHHSNPNAPAHEPIITIGKNADQPNNTRPVTELEDSSPQRNPTDGTAFTNWPREITLSFLDHLRLDTQKSDQRTKSIKDNATPNHRSG